VLPYPGHTHHCLRSNHHTDTAAETTPATTIIQPDPSLFELLAPFFEAVVVAGVFAALPLGVTEAREVTMSAELAEVAPAEVARGFVCCVIAAVALPGYSVRHDP
jgi:hypothetical protein